MLCNSQPLLLAFSSPGLYRLPMNLGKRLRAARVRRKLTQEGLAEQVKGASQAMISALESRDSETTLLLFELADALKVSPRWLLTGSEPSGLDSPLPEHHEPLLRQLIALYGGLSQDGRDQLVGNANRIFSAEHPEKSTANPFPAKPTPQVAKTRR